MQPPPSLQTTAVKASGSYVAQPQWTGGRGPFLHDCLAILAAAVAASLPSELPGDCCSSAHSRYKDKGDDALIRWRILRRHIVGTGGALRLASAHLHIFYGQRDGGELAALAPSQVGGMFTAVLHHINC